MGKLDGKVVFITGAGRGQGRSHAVRFAEEGADVIAIDIAADIDSVAYPMATPEDLEETARLVKAHGRQIVTHVADVRDPDAIKAAVDDGIAQLGRLDFVLCNAGIAPHGGPMDEWTAWNDVIAVNLTGVFNTVKIAAPHMIEQGDGGAILITSSTQGLNGRGGDGSAAVSGYGAAKTGVVGLMRSWAHWLAPYGIRVNTVHPTGVNAPMTVNPFIDAWFQANAERQGQTKNLLDVDLLEPITVSNAMLYLCSEDGTYITGTTFQIDAGFVAR
jgi:SDR family mycofactocin-dependent oxidoreductase